MCVLKLVRLHLVEAGGPVAALELALFPRDDGIGPLDYEGAPK